MTSQPTPPAPPTGPQSTPSSPAPTPSGAATTTGSPVDTLVKGATDAAQQARAQVARAAAQNRGKIAAAVDRLGATIDSRTGNRYHQHVAKAKGWVEKGIDVVAGTPGAASSSAAPTTAAAPGAPAPTTPTAQAAPTAPTAPAAPAKPAEGWHRGPNGDWVRS